MMGIDRRALGVTWTVFVFVLFLCIIWYIRATLMVFATAVFFAYMLSPMVDLVERFFQRRRGLALAVVYSLLIVSLIVVGLNLIPALANQAISLVTRLPNLISSGNISKLPLPGLLEPMREQVIPILNRAATNLESKIVPFVQEAGSSILSGLGQIIPVILVPILAFFFLKDARSIKSVMLLNVPRQHRPTVVNIMDDIHNVLRSYIRALVLLAVASFSAWVLFFTVMRYPYELLLAGIAGALEFIPVVGPAAALAIMLTVFIVTGTSGVLWVIVFWVVFRLFQDYVLSPYLMSSGVEMHPLLVLFGVLAGDALGGVPGMFFSVPILAILRAVFTRMEEQTKSHADQSPALH